MSIFRRRLMMQAKAQPLECPYITDGLEFWLDGINKGKTSNAWTDLVGGLVFNNVGSVSATSTENAWYFAGDGNINMRLGGTAFPNSANRTIEACFKNEIGSTLFIFISGTQTTDNLCLIMDRTYRVLFLQRRQTYNFFPTLNMPHCVSLNMDAGLYDGSAVSKSSSTYWSSNNFTNIGRRDSSASAYKGYIYSIRVYDRKLTSEEMLFNQRVDNERFNLDLDL